MAKGGVMAKVKAKQAIEQVTDIPAESGEIAQELPPIAEQAPLPPARPLLFPELQPAEPPKPVDPFAYSDIKDIVRVAAGYQCAVKFLHRDDYLAYLACPDDVEAHGRAIHAECEARAADGVPDYFPSDDEFLTVAQERMSGELRRANSEVTKYQDRVDVDDASDADIGLLLAWKKYRVALNRIPDQAGYPHVITWPVTPDPATV
ncbi:caudovirales tail fiber assembly family protein [Collimonas pratensis]|uniref:Caudovirales tail fiber assembly family protein n=2 Tax=Collimonas pratensis TaxID=279113 RepID=A0ABM5Z3S1_9BURK|nr:caudovirales tail fiber assembly family protein [Collimonas pratensis]